MWTGGCVNGDVAIMVCVAINGFHSKASYQWFKRGEVLGGAVHPIIYVETPGDYCYTVTIEGTEEKREFRVTGDYIVQLLV